MQTALEVLLVDLANTDDEGLSGFRRKWWDLQCEYRTDQREAFLRARDELRLIWLKSCDLPRIPPNPSRALEWLRKPLARSLQELVCEHWLSQLDPLILHVEWTGSSKRILPPGNSLLGLLAFAFVEFGDRVAYCWNETCSKPFFVANRKDKRYCSSKCAAEGRKESKRKWWEENRGQNAKWKASREEGKK